MERVIKVKKRKTADETLKDISNYDSSHFKFLNINGEDKDVARLDMLYETMEKNGLIFLMRSHNLCGFVALFFEQERD